MMRNPYPFGGPGVIVEVDEAKLGAGSLGGGSLGGGSLAGDRITVGSLGGTKVIP